MFKRKQECPYCGKKIDRKFNFCPYCGRNLKGKDKKKREIEGPEIFASFGPLKIKFPFDKIFKNFDIDKVFREMDKELRDFDKERKISGISINIKSTDGIPKIQVRRFGEPLKLKKPEEEKIKPIKIKTLTKEQEKKLEKLQELPKKEPASRVRRLTDRIVYEIDLPGVKKENVFVNRLQNSIEIKAFTDKEAFFKLLPISLPILNYKIDKGKLILELKPEN